MTILSENIKIYPVTLKQWCIDKFPKIQISIRTSQIEKNFSNESKLRSGTFERNVWLAQHLSTLIYKKKIQYFYSTVQPGCKVDSILRKNSTFLYPFWQNSRFHLSRKAWISTVMHTTGIPIKTNWSLSTLKKRERERESEQEKECHPEISHTSLLFYFTRTCVK